MNVIIAAKRISDAGFRILHLESVDLAEQRLKEWAEAWARRTALPGLIAQHGG